MTKLHATSKWLAAGLLLSVASVSFAGANLEIPAPVSIPSGKSEKDIKEAISLGATARNWVVKETAPGVMEARVDVRNKHTLIVDLKYDAQQVALAYKNSSNLDYEVVNGNPQIHRNANSWMKNLMTDISKFLNR